MRKNLELSAELLFAAKEVTSNVHTAPEVGMMSVGADKNYAVETDTTGLLCLKESLEVLTCKNPVNEDGIGSCLLFKL